MLGPLLEGGGTAVLRDRNCKSSNELVPDHFQVIVIYDEPGSRANYCVVELSFRDTANVHPF